jgi:hypothetical protein
MNSPDSTRPRAMRRSERNGDMKNTMTLTEIQFNLERLADRIALPQLTIDVVPNAKAFVDLFLNVIESAEGLRIDCDYNRDLLDETTVAPWLNCYRVLPGKLCAGEYASQD